MINYCVRVLSDCGWTEEEWKEQETFIYFYSNFCKWIDYLIIKSFCILVFHFIRTFINYFHGNSFFFHFRNHSNCFNNWFSLIFLRLFLFVSYWINNHFSITQIFSAHLLWNQKQKQNIHVLFLFFFSLSFGLVSADDWCQNEIL